MKLNETIAELTNNFTEYGEGLYNLAFMGEPSATEPWGWQIDGHHLIVNYFVLGDQVVMTPMFMGSEPVARGDRQVRGHARFEVEENKGLAFMRALTPEQQQTATIGPEPRPRTTASGTGYRDNFEMRYEGLKVSAT